MDIDLRARCQELEKELDEAQQQATRFMQQILYQPCGHPNCCRRTTDPANPTAENSWCGWCEDVDSGATDLRTALEQAESKMVMRLQAGVIGKGNQTCILCDAHVASATERLQHKAECPFYILNELEVSNGPGDHAEIGSA